MSPPIRVYIENARARPAVYWITPDLLAEALGGRPALSGRIDVSLAFDDDGRDDLLSEAEVILGSKVDTARGRSTARRLVWFHSTSAGVENLAPFDWLPKGAQLSNSRGIHAAKARDFAKMALLLLNERMPEHYESQQKRVWRRVYSTPIAGKHLVLVGLGHLGRAVAEAARELGVHITGVRRAAGAVDFADRTVTTDALDSVLPEADFVVLAAPLTPQTRGLFGAAQFARMKDGAGFVNIGRGPLADYAALEVELRQGRLGGAILDVFDTEPLPADAPWWTVPRLIVVPHVSADDEARYATNALSLFLDHLEAYLAGKPLPNRVDLDAGY
ncbi:MAG: D-2-hydroxyacid dehydrogenase [Devosiaceae bacterium]|nr:D-2-hydroxyacid dehydrogenase [Devosiaceae bacterium MH13]